MTKEELKLVSDCKTTRFFKKGDVIFEEGEALNGVFCVRDGVAKLTKLNANGKDQTVKLLGRGDMIGQRSVISNERTNLSAVALNDIELCYVPRDQIVNPLQKNQEFSFDVLQNFAKDLKNSEDDLVNMAQKSVKQRIAETLLYVHRTFGVDANGYLSVVLSREDYASIVGTATESTIRILSQFKKDGFISTEGKLIKIENLEKLRQVE
ncbi:Crp/Fnr family transcriptional regulator [Subsaximicrobium wynnwilliamsii]|uniref:Crp/Fnr family transcriptional regulator n=2 Tax=Subsaximicrobium wynnwilliamsii TaxID=291179 RepID=A0A5C6ZI52_9FLAO|nr:Crp/Fnr family transcriptional regulator [Subsaximicrobium wynnwilliamsii]TXD88861.1 Crp/Fnr family transcriptional regulator [Subsaximicrobium wynnwilliamsii]TXE02934.1 Crp/Fnr family transcriptional regulator [Subsaximicrobium wynnwilliamsii]